MKRILIDIGHPAHVHLFKNFALLMQNKGHEILFTVRQKEFETDLLKASNLKYKVIGKHYKSKFGKLFGIIKFDIKIFKIAKKFRPDFFLSHGSFYAAHIAWLTRKTHISLEDTGNQEQVILYKIFTKVILSPKYLNKSISKKQIFYNGIHEAAYLNRKYFKSDSNIFKSLGITAGDNYMIIRFVSWNASHDNKKDSININDKINLTRHFSQFIKVFVSSETELPKELLKYKLHVHPLKFHHVLGKAILYIRDGATTASEAVMLGVPAIFFGNNSLDTIKHQSNKGLLHLTNNVDKIKEIAYNIIMTNDRTEHKKKWKEFISEIIDLTAFLVWFIENYPRSYNILKKNPDYQYNFK